MADLIQHGHMTPFGGQIIDGVCLDGKGIEFSSNSTVPSNSAIPVTITKNSDETPCDSNLRNTDSNSEIHDEIEIHDETVGENSKAVLDVNDDNTDDESSTSEDAFIPDMTNDDLYYTTSDSYITDDDHDDEIRGHSSKVRRYRDIISSESDDDMIHNNKIKHKKIKERRPSLRRLRTLTVDDGDDQVYKMRVK